MSQSWSNAYLGIHYSRMDCWQLCVHVYARERGVELPSYRGLYPREPELRAWSEMIEGEASSQRWVEVEGLKHARPLDLMRFWVMDPSNPSHLGIFVDRSTMLTTKRSTGSLHEPIGRWLTRLSGIHRLVEEPEP